MSLAPEPSTALLNRVQPATYFDSLVLMGISADLLGIEGIAQAVLMMGSETNKIIMREAALLDEAGDLASGNDLIVALRGETFEACEVGWAQALQRLESMGEPSQVLGQDAEAARPGDREAPELTRSLSAALAQDPRANLVLISVPGEHAAREARQALGARRHVMMFSDNVAIEDEVELKRLAAEQGLLFMGPDCGTAILGGTPLGFANALPRGHLGIVGASGTGIQELSTLLAHAGIGISQAIGVGGRDLSESVAGAGTLAALDALEGDPQTTQIALVAKSPSARALGQLNARIAASSKPVSVCLYGIDPADVSESARAHSTIESLAESLVGNDVTGASSGASAQSPAEVMATPLALFTGGTRGTQRLIGLFSGGTLCLEAMVVLSDGGVSGQSNVTLDERFTPTEAVDLAQPTGHQLLDLGADRYTRGRAHPMIDPRLRAEMLDSVLASDAFHTVLLDVVLGYGAHDDPAQPIIEVMSRHRPSATEIIAHVCGCIGDPQGYEAQRDKLENAGVRVARSMADAARLARARCLH